MKINDRRDSADKKMCWVTVPTGAVVQCGSDAAQYFYMKASDRSGVRLDNGSRFPENAMLMGKSYLPVEVELNIIK